MPSLPQQDRDAESYYQKGLDCLRAKNGGFSEKKRAVSFLKKAAELRHPRAEYVLAVMSKSGEGMLPSAKRYLMYLQRAAAHELPVAQRELGSLYAKGVEDSFAGLFELPPEAGNAMKAGGGGAGNFGANSAGRDYQSPYDEIQSQGAWSPRDVPGHNSANDGASEVGSVGVLSNGGRVFPTSGRKNMSKVTRVPGQDQNQARREYWERQQQLQQVQLQRIVREPQNMIDRSLNKARSLFRKAANCGEVGAWKDLAQHLPGESLLYWEKSSQSSDPEGLFVMSMLGLFFAPTGGGGGGALGGGSGLKGLLGKRYKQYLGPVSAAITNHGEFGPNGSPNAATGLPGPRGEAGIGSMSKNPRFNIPRISTALAVDYLKSAAHKRWPEALFLLGELYRGSPDLDTGVHALQGGPGATNASAQANSGSGSALANSLRSGLLRRDCVKASRYLSLACELLTVQRDSLKSEVEHLESKNLQTLYAMDRGILSRAQAVRVLTKWREVTVRRRYLLRKMITTNYERMQCRPALQIWHNLVTRRLLHLRDVVEEPFQKGKILGNIFSQWVYRCVVIPRRMGKALLNRYRQTRMSKLLKFWRSITTRRRAACFWLKSVINGAIRKRLSWDERCYLTFDSHLAKIGGYDNNNPLLDGNNSFKAPYGHHLPEPKSNHLLKLPQGVSAEAVVESIRGRAPNHSPRSLILKEFAVGSAGQILGNLAGSAPNTAALADSNMVMNDISSEQDLRLIRQENQSVAVPGFPFLSIQEPAAYRRTWLKPYIFFTGRVESQLHRGILKLQKLVGRKLRGTGFILLGRKVVLKRLETELKPELLRLAEREIELERRVVEEQRVSEGLRVEIEGWKRRFGQETQMNRSLVRNVQAIQQGGVLVPLEDDNEGPGDAPGGFGASYTPGRGLNSSVNTTANTMINYPMPNPVQAYQGAHPRESWARAIPTGGGYSPTGREPTLGEISGAIQARDASVPRGGLLQQQGPGGPWLPQSSWGGNISGAENSFALAQEEPESLTNLAYTQTKILHENSRHQREIRADSLHVPDTRHPISMSAERLFKKRVRSSSERLKGLVQAVGEHPPHVTGGHTYRSEDGSVSPAAGWNRSYGAAGGDIRRAVIDGEGVEGERATTAVPGFPDRDRGPGPNRGSRRDIHGNLLDRLEYGFDDHELDRQDDPDYADNVDNYGEESNRERVFEPQGGDGGDVLGATANSGGNGPNNPDGLDNNGNPSYGVNKSASAAARQGPVGHLDRLNMKKMINKRGSEQGWTGMTSEGVRSGVQNGAGYRRPPGPRAGETGRMDPNYAFEPRGSGVKAPTMRGGSVPPGHGTSVRRKLPGAAGRSGAKLMGSNSRQGTGNLGQSDAGLDQLRALGPAASGTVRDRTGGNGEGENDAASNLTSSVSAEMSDEGESHRLGPRQVGAAAGRAYRASNRPPRPHLKGLTPGTGVRTVYY